MAKLATDRLTLRPFRHSDARDFARLAGEWTVASMTSDIPFPLTPEQAVLWLRPAKGEVRYGVEYRGTLIGGVGFYRRPSGAAELGFWLGKDWWGHGFATEAARAVICHGFRKHDVPLFTSAHFFDNSASRNVLVKLGFQHSGGCRIDCVARGEAIEASTYALDRTHAARAIPALAQSASAPRERLREFLTWMRGGWNRRKRPASSSQPT